MLFQEKHFPKLSLSLVIPKFKLFVMRLLMETNKFGGFLYMKVYIKCTYPKFIMF